MMYVEKTELGNTGVQISNLALGTMYFGSKVSKQLSFSILDEYFGYGGDFLDSANKYASWIDGYKGGESEQIIGDWMTMKRNREQLFLTSKVGFAYGDVPRSLKKEVIVSECEKSLKRLNTDTIDLYFAHTYDADTPVDETMEAFFQLKKAGKIRFAGASNMYGWQLFETNQAAKIQGWEGFSCLQQRYSYLQPSLDADFGTQLLLTPETKKYCELNKISVMAYSPLLGGYYADRSKEISQYYMSNNSNAKLKTLELIAGELNVSCNTVVLKWMIQSNPIIIPVFTASNLLQFNENINVLNITLSENHINMLNATNEKPKKYA